MTDRRFYDNATGEQGPEPRSGATLLLALYIPGAAHDVDPEMCADVLAALINEERRRNGIDPDIDDDGGWFAGDVTVSALPACQWVTSETLGVLRRAALLETTETHARRLDAPPDPT